MKNLATSPSDLGYVVVTDYIEANTGLDVSDAIQKIINENPHRTIYFPDGEYILSPEFYLIKHFAHFVKDGAVMLSTKGGMSTNTTVFKNTDGSRVAIIMNPYGFEKNITLEGKSYTLEPNSFNTIVI